MNPVYLTVLEICGDYARLRSDDGEERQTALFFAARGY